MQTRMNIEVFRRVDWQRGLASVSSRTCTSYETVYTNNFIDAQKNEDEDGIIVYGFLMDITSLYIKLDEAEQPFFPSVIMGTRRSLAYQDLTEEHFLVLKEMLLDIDDMELRARIADLIWTKTKDRDMAAEAITAYLASSEVLDGSVGWFYQCERLERAFQIANRYGKNGPFYSNVAGYFCNILDADTTPPAFFIRLLGILNEVRSQETLKYIPVAERMAIKAEDTKKWDIARNLWELAAKLHKQNKSEENCKRCLLRSAESYNKEAQEVVAGNAPSYLRASALIEQEIAALRKIGQEPEKIQERHRLLLEYQQLASTELGEISVQFDATELVKIAQSRVVGKSLKDALFTLAMFCSIPKKDALRDEVIRQTQQFTFQALVAKAYLNREGKIISRRPAMNVGNDTPDDNSDFLRAEMLQRADFSRAINVATVIHPVVDQIRAEHAVRISDFYEIVQNNSFVPPNRAEIFARGLYHGFMNDFLLSSHLLVPQIENSIRYVLFQNGAVTSGYDNAGIQEEYLLGNLLFRKDVEDVFGEDLVFDLQGLLIEPVGGNLRNEVSHGLLDVQDFFGHNGAYLWWLVLRICCWPFLTNTFSRTDEDLPDSDTHEHV